MDKIVSVVMPTYNRKKLTDQALESVVTSFPDMIEIIVVDDCSSAAYSFDAMNDSGVPVRVRRLESNVGPGMARKEGVKQARGRFVAFLDSDDLYDKGWMDYVVNLLINRAELSDGRVLISGITQGEKRLGAFVRWALATTPKSLQLLTSRLVAILFNPFCTPSTVLSRNLCFFEGELRYCEDYYTTAMALFIADEVVFPPVVSCYLGRDPNSIGGESAERGKMFKGEMQVRRALLREEGVPLRYKLFIPVGMAYQWFRVIIKRIFSAVL